MVAADIQDHDAVKWLGLYGDALYRFAIIRVQDSFAAEDLVQETLLAAYCSYENFSGKSTVRTWLTGILKHKIVDYYRRMKPEQGDENIEDFAYGMDDLFDKKERWKVKPGDWSGDPKNLFERKELMTIIYGCLAEMPGKMSTVYTMRELEGAETSEICEAFQIGENNCWVILYRARMLLRRCLEVNWFGGKKERS